MLLNKILRFIVIGGIFLLPLIVFIVATPFFFPYITGKNFAFRIIVEIMAGAWLALATVDVKARPRRSWILLAFALFTLIVAIADAQGAYPFKSFWSNYERMDGWVTIAHLCLYLFVTASIMTSEKLWRLFFQWSLGISAFVSLYGLLQLAGVVSVGQATGAGLAARIDATFGNPIYLAVYMLFHVFLAALLWAQSWAERSYGQRMGISIAYCSVIVLDTIVLLFTGTRGTTLGLVGGATIAGLLLVFLNGNSRYAWRAAGAIAASIIVVVGGLSYFREASFVKNIGFLDRLASISVNDPTIRSRVMNAGMAWEGVKERPLFGWGQENYAIVFDKYYDPRMYGQEPWFDRTHDIIFDWLVAAGFFGIISYLSIFAAAFFALWRSGTFTVPERSILSGLLLGYFFHNLFVFDNVTSYILFATFLAYIAWRTIKHEDASSMFGTNVLPAIALPVATVAAIAVVWTSAWYVNAKAMQTNQTLIMALVQSGTGKLDQGLASFIAAANSGTLGNQEAREQLIQGASALASNQSVPIETKQKFFNAAVSQMQMQALASPLDARFPLFLGIIFNTYGDYADAAVALQKAHELSPKKQSILYQMGLNADARGKSVEAIDYYKKAFELETDNLDARLFYAAALVRASDDAKADEVLAPAIVTGEAADSRVAAAYAARNRYDKIAAIWRGKINASPNDIKSYFTLAAALYADKHAADAIGVLQEVSTKFPDAASEAAKYMQQIKDGTIGKK